MNEDQNLIACLEGEIAKRDETIARLEPQLNRAIQANYDLRAELSAIKAQEPVAFAFRYDDGSWHDVSATQHSAGMVSLYAAPVYEAKAQGMVMPERMTWDGLRATACNIRGEGWNACLDEVARLNAAPVQQVSVPDAGLVEALENVLKSGRGSSGRIILDEEDEADARAALAAHRANGGV